MNHRLSYFRLYQLLKSTHYGSILAQHIRFSDFIPASVSYSRWEKVLGADVNNMRHMWYTKQLTDQFLAYSLQHQPTLFSSHEIHLLRLTATFHDLAESIIGDIAKTRKTSHDELAEKHVLIKLIRELNTKYPELQPLIPDMVVCIDEILFPENPTKLSRAFLVIENLGYLHTACKSWNFAYYAAKPTALAKGLNRLAHEVIPYCLKRLHTYEDQFPAIRDFLAAPQIRYAIEAETSAQFQPKPSTYSYPLPNFVPQLLSSIQSRKILWPIMRRLV